MTEDLDGSIWFGGQNGIVRYDGVSWVRFSDVGLADTRVLSLTTARDGSVYASGVWGISRFSDGVWTRVFPIGSDRQGWWIRGVMEDTKGDLWAGTWFGILQLTRGVPILYTTAYLEPSLRMWAPDVRLVIVPDESAVLRTTSGEHTGARGYGRPGGPWMVLHVPRDTPAERAGLKPGDLVTKVDGGPPPGGPGQASLRGPAGSTLVLTVQRDGSRDPFDLQVVSAKVELAHRTPFITHVYEDGDGMMWFVMGRGGRVLRFDIRHFQSGGAAPWRLFTRSDGLDIPEGASAFSPRILQARDGIIWMVTGRGGAVNRFDGNTWTSFQLSGVGGSAMAYSILEARDGTLWVKSNEGLHAYRRGEWTVYSREDLLTHLGSGRAGLLQASDGSLWVTAAGGEVARLNLEGGRWKAYEGLRLRCETSDGSLWFTAADGRVVRRARGEWTQYSTADGLIDTVTTVLDSGDGSIWVAGRHTPSQVKWPCAHARKATTL